MTLFTVRNLTETTGALSAPWDFKFAPETISEHVRKDKKARQEWYQNPTTKHCFYSGLLGVVESARISKENPPRAVSFFVADYDCHISDERMREAVEHMKVKPTHIETSIGGNRRLCWALETPILLESAEFSHYLHEKAIDWLRLHQLPALDEPAWKTPTRLYCCGDTWEATGHPPVSAKDTQFFFVECAKSYRFKNCNEVAIGLDVVEAELKRKFPAFSWPVDFVVNSQGPSFWVEGSLSASSAIVKAEGMFTFAAHAAKPFYSWSDLLGSEFMADYVQTAVVKATADIWYDGRSFHRKIGDRFVSLRKDEFLNYLQIDCGLSEKKDKSGKSPVQAALSHIYNMQRVTGAAPFVPLPQGTHIFMGTRHLNTYGGKAEDPAAGTQKFGPSGNFPFSSALFAGFFNPLDLLEDYFAWAKYFYEGVLNKVCRPGPAMYLIGPPGCGKTFVSRSIWGPAVGGFADASQFILKGSQFNSNLLSVPLWSLDDDTTSASDWLANQSHMMIKKIIANDTFEFHQKYEVPCMTGWGGRLHVTANLGETNGRVIGTLDESMLAKISLLKCMDVAARPDGFQFPARAETAALIAAERRYLLRYLLDYQVPDRIVRDARYGFLPRHEESLFEKAQASSPTGPFKEIVLDWLTDWFVQNPEAATFEATASNLIKQIACSSVDQTITRSIKPEKLLSYFEQLSNEGFLRCTSKVIPPHNVRLWTFHRPL